MDFDADDRLMALATAFRALTIALVKSGSLAPEQLEEQSTRGIAWLEGIGATGASGAMAEVMEPIIADIRRHGGST